MPASVPHLTAGPGIMPHVHSNPPDGRLLDHGRHTPYFGQPDYRIYEMNKRLQQRTEDSDSLWWDAFATEFFEDDATLTLTFCLEDGPKRYTIGRTLIPRYFRSIFEGGVTDLSFNLKHPKESFHNTTITLDCDQCTMITSHGKPLYNKGILGGPYPSDPLKEQFVKDSAVVDSDSLWWDAFATEFFEDDATLTLTFCLEDGPKRYTIGRTLIPRYFRSIFEGGVTDLSFNLKHPKESFHNTTITLDCDQCTMITSHGKPLYNKGILGGPYPSDPLKEQFVKDSAVVVCTEGRLILEFTFDDLMRIKSWHFATRQHRELISRGLIAMQCIIEMETQMNYIFIPLQMSPHIEAQQQDPAMLDQLTKNITRQGLTNSTLNYLRLCVILEPMQELMSRHKAYALSPRDCLKTTLFQKWQRMVAPPETQRPPSKRRKRKTTTNSTGNTATGGGKKKNISPGPSFSLASQDVMVVGEPSLMGGEFGDEDERLITRLENTQYDASAAAANGLDEEEFTNPPMSSVTSTASAPQSSSWSGPPTSGPQTAEHSTSSSGGPGSVPPPTTQEDKKSSPSISQ
ncbi:LIM domain-binding protein 2-like isoform X3 [Centruroides sculpturatus]|uniref:LIM domain-binding protein 2-like isoform X3 n=1 Tax=Centruroides sculpturatus TaxID=218467 RepID=UPI000C6DDAAF|nr:LIM domain-binding protein 2-like isoform X3 [Centruroides sculpturatus]